MAAAVNTTNVSVAQQGSNANFTPASLYVGDLKPDVSEALLFDVFNNVGPVASIRVCRDVVTRKSLGYAYVNFHNVNDAERALDTLNFSSIRGQPCRIMWSQRDPSLRKSGLGNIFVKNLDKSIDHKTLYDTFSMFGNILSCKVSMNEKGESLGYGFVHYESEEAAKKAIDKVNGMVIASREVIVAPFKPKNQRDGPMANSFTNVYVKNLPKETTEEKLLELFGEHGKVTSHHIVMAQDGSGFTGVAFVNFETAEEAQSAIDKLHVGNEQGELCVCRAQKKYERTKELSAKFDKLRIEQAEKYSGLNLYIKNLDDVVDDGRLRQEFEQFGEITSAKVMRDPANQRSKGFGFVCFSRREDATKAVTEMNGKLMCNKPLYVALAQRKEIRRQQLEQQANSNRQKMQTGIPNQMSYGMPQNALFYQQPAGMQPVGAMGAQQQFGYVQQPAMVPAQAQWGRGQQGRGQQVPVQAGMYAMMPPAQQVPVQQPRSMPTRAAMDQSVNKARNNYPTPGGPTPGGPGGNLSAEALANSTPQQQKQMIGERLYPLIQERQPKLAGKITGMLLEMDNTELLHLLDSNEALESKISEALAVLRAHETDLQGPVQ